MTSPQTDAEREVDLARWRRALVTLWWLPAAGLVLGAIAGVLYGITGGSSYNASALISPGQPTSPGGSVVSSYGTNPRAIFEIVTSASALHQAAATAGVRESALRGNISVADVGTVAGSTARTTPLISLTVTGSHAVPTENAANALARIAVAKTTAAYVATKIRTYNTTLQSVDTQLTSVKNRIAVIERALAAAKKLDPLQQLVIATQEDNAETRLGNLIAQQEVLQQQLTFASQVEAAKIVETARSVKSSAHSRNLSLLVGAIIGLILGAIVAIAGENRFRRASA